MNTQNDVLSLLDQVLGLEGRAKKFHSHTQLLGALPELDSMAVVTLVTMLEDRYGIAINDDEISGDTFATVGSLTDFVAAKLTE